MQSLKQITIRVINKIAPNYLGRRYKRKLENIYLKKNKKLKDVYKIIYTLTPPPRLSNIGDQAQVVAIYKWIKDNFPGVPIFEVDKDECTSMISPLKKIVNNEDLIFIHSGGNLGDRGMWSETGRRNIIQNFTKNRIISLPQTMYFSDTEKGKSEKLKTIEIYNKHKNLTVIGRDPESGKLAKEMFPNCNTFSMPDFVLYLNVEDILQDRCSNPRGTLLCLRNDNESILTETLKNKLKENVIKPIDIFDTTIEQEILPNSRLKHLKETIMFFDTFEYIITDRYHGLIFAAILQKPTIVLPTIDHKLSSACEWFKDIKNIRFAGIEDIEKIQTIMEDIRNLRNVGKNWNSDFFSKLRDQINS